MVVLQTVTPVVLPTWKILMLAHVVKGSNSMAVDWITLVQCSRKKWEKRYLIDIVPELKLKKLNHTINSMNFIFVCFY